MELRLANDLIIKCETCCFIKVINKYSLDIYTISSERNMGNEVEYEFFGDCFCDNCDNYMKYKVIANEYPVGALDFQTSECSGCSLIQEPSIEVIYLEFDYYDYEEINTDVEYAYESIFKVLQTENEIYNISPREFEIIVAEIFKQQGYEVELTPETRDGGCDIIATKSIGGIPFMLLVECKRYAKGNPVGVSLVRSLLGVQEDRKANKAILVTTSRFTKEAKDFANRQQHLISLMDINDLIQILEK